MKYYERLKIRLTSIDISFEQIAIAESVCFIYIFSRILTISPFTYRISLYQGVPFDVFIASGAAALGILVLTPYSFEHGGFFMLNLALVFTILPFAVVKYLYLTRDSIMHIGRINSILVDGTIPVNNIYPAMHIEAAFIKNITGLSPTQTGVIFVIFGTVTLAGLVIVSLRRLPLSPSQYALFLFFGLTAIFGFGLYNFAPWGQLHGIFLLLVVFFTTFRVGKGREWSIALIFVIITSAFAHPLISLAIAVLLSTSSLYDMFESRSLTEIRPAFPLLTIIALVSWVIRVPQTRYHIRTSVLALLGLTSERSSAIATAANQLSSADVTLIDAVSVAVARYGFNIGLLGFILVVFVLRWIFLGKRNKYYEPIVFTVFLLWLFGVMGLVLPIPFGAGRFWRAAIILGLVVVASDFEAITQFFPRLSTPLVSVALVGILLLAVVAGATVYHSSFDRRPSPQLTEGEYNASKWLFNYREDGSIMELGISVRQMIAYIETSQSFAQGNRPEDHFSEIRTKQADGYLIVAPPAKRIYQELYPEYREAWAFTPSDYRYLESAAPINRVYTSGNTTIYYR